MPIFFYEFFFKNIIFRRNSQCYFDSKQAVVVTTSCFVIHLYENVRHKAPLKNQAEESIPNGSNNINLHGCDM